MKQQEVSRHRAFIRHLFKPDGLQFVWKVAIGETRHIPTWMRCAEGIMDPSLSKRAWDLHWNVAKACMRGLYDPTWEFQPLLEDVLDDPRMARALRQLLCVDPAVFQLALCIRVLRGGVTDSEMPPTPKKTGPVADLTRQLRFGSPDVMVTTGHPHKGKEARQ